jgi:ribosomal protein S18 acetylase RimI-like enzyme
MEILVFNELRHRQQVVNLWQTVFGYQAAHNAPELIITKKVAVADGLFFVALHDSQVIGTVMTGYDGHRGWIYSLAVHPDFRKQKIGSALLAHAEKKLSDLGCVKVNLQIMEGNEAVESFYLANGYATEKRISMGKRLSQNPA